VGVSGLAVDGTYGKMYWANWIMNSVSRANLDGTDVETLVPDIAHPLGLALDVPHGKMYWVDWEINKVQRANLDGSNLEDLIDTGLDNPFGLALDLNVGKMYWTDWGLKKIQRADLDGSNVEDVISTGLETPLGIAVYAAGGTMYWTDNGTNKIQRATLGGSSVEDLVTTGLDTPVGIALDPGAGKMYWCDSTGAKVQRSNMDGSNRETLATNVAGPMFITLGPEVPSGELLVTQANGGEEWGCGTTQTITWRNLSGDAGPEVRVGLEKGGVFVDWIVRRTDNDGVYNWVVWTDLEPGDDYAVRVQSYTDNAYRDLSDVPFTITALAVEVPNGGEAWVMGDVRVVEWGSHDTLVGADVRIGLHLGTEFLDWIDRQTENDGRYHWKVPTDLAPGIGYRIRVQSFADNTLRDLTDVPFTIVLPALMWTSPGLQHVLVWGSTYEVTWVCNNMGAVGPNVRIGLHKGGAFIDWIRLITPNDGAFSWTVGQRLGALAPASSYRLRLQSYTDKNVRCMTPAFVIAE